jgi:hypothetical protein
MARTLNGNFTGMAARIDRTEFLETIREDHAKQQEKISRGVELFRTVMEELRLADPDGWEKFYETDAIPEHLNWLEIEPVIATIRGHIHDITISNNREKL